MAACRRTTRSSRSRSPYRPLLPPAVLGLLLLVAPPTGAAQPVPGDDQATILILHTNDIHDHVRPDYDGSGGLAYVAGYVRDVRSRRDDILLLDAGDVAEKGDLVARKTSSDMVFEAMSRIGYDAWAPGNHDHDFGIPALRRFTELAGMDILCINLFEEDGSLEFEPSAIYDVGGVRVGVIGAIRPRQRLSLDLEGTAAAMAREARRLDPLTDLVVGLVHISASNAALIARTAPDIDVIVSGHSHQALHEPIVVPETGALIVQAGSNAEYVGRLELTIDTAADRIVRRDAGLVPMDHRVIRPDLAMMEWVRQEEQRLAPEALRVISWTPEPVGYLDIGYLAAEAIRIGTGADIGFNHTESVVRARFPAGTLDYNAVYRTGGERGKQLVEVELTGHEIEGYLRLLAAAEQYQTQWSGFRVVGDEPLRTDLDPDRTYRVVMPEREWETRFLRFFDRLEDHREEWAGVTPLERLPTAEPVDPTWTDVVVDLLQQWDARNLSVTAGIAEIVAKTGQGQVVVAPGER